MEEMKEHGYNFGGEQSGHFIFRDHNTTGDGIVSAVQLLQIMKEKGQPLSELRKVLTRFPQVQRNIRVHTKPVIETLAAASIIQEIRETLGDAGRVMLRYSGTEPLLRVLLEGKDADWIDDQADRLAASIEAEIGA
jgi:phosphoglucosamine mutase